MKLKYVYTCHSYCVTEYTGYNESQSTSASVRIEILSIKTWKRAEKTDDVTLKSKAESYRTECDRQRAIEREAAKAEAEVCITRRYSAPQRFEACGVGVVGGGEFTMFPLTSVLGGMTLSKPLSCRALLK